VNAKELPDGTLTKTQVRKMKIKRDVYLERLINRKYDRFVKMITGIRRCGKSYLLNLQIFFPLSIINIYFILKYY